MSTSKRVAAEQFSNAVEFLGGGSGLWAVDKVGEQWRIYEAHNTYTATTGGSTARGQVVRRYDPQAGEREGLIGQWQTKAQAVDYARDYLLPCKSGPRGASAALVEGRASWGQG